MTHDEDIEHTIHAHAKALYLALADQKKKIVVVLCWAYDFDDEGAQMGLMTMGVQSRIRQIQTLRALAQRLENETPQTVFSHDDLRNETN